MLAPCHRRSLHLLPLALRTGVPRAADASDPQRHPASFTAVFRKRTPARSSAARIASVVKSPTVLRHVLGSIRKEKLMDTQTVIAVCEWLLVVIGIVSLTRKDE